MAKDHFAVLIDADNAQPALVAELLAEVARHGTATVKRAYGDWTRPNLAGWKETLHVHAIQPMQQFSYTSGKNATDASLIIDAMDLLHGGKVDGFCLVSSDSDFTPLATRIREAGLRVLGIGERKTPMAFVKACDQFIYTDLLREPAAAPAAAPAKKAENPELRKKLLEAVEANEQDDGWAHLGTVGSLLIKNDPAFDPRSFGFKKLSDLVKAQRYLETQSAPASKGSPHQILLVRRKGG